MTSLSSRVYELHKFIYTEIRYKNSISRLELDLVYDFLESIKRNSHLDEIETLYNSYHTVVRNLNVLQKPYNSMLSNYMFEVYQEWKMNRTFH